jgi:hypothetical protein
MDKLVCLECNKKFKNEAGLHRHLRTHKIRLVEYYQKYYPRYDKYDNTFIRFKSKDFYFNNDFNSRANLKNWLNKVSPNEAKAYIRDYLLRRKQNKGLTFAPCQVELRTLPLPGMAYMNRLFGSYYQFCEELGFKVRYPQPKFYLTPTNIKKNKIIVDSREQKPLQFTLKTKTEGLKFGDYKLDNEEATCKCYIERKSIPDFYGTFSSGYDRFKREVFRAQEASASLIVVVEGTLDEIPKFPFASSPEYVFHNVRDLIQRYPHVQFLFVNGRGEAVRVIEKIFASNCEYKEIDLQYAYDTKEL